MASHYLQKIAQLRSRIFTAADNPAVSPWPFGLAMQDRVACSSSQSDANILLYL